jgi:CRP-like cAMP-binding protein
VAGATRAAPRDLLEFTPVEVKVTRLDALLGDVPFLEPLRPDELHRATRHWKIVELAPGESRPLAASVPECAVVLSGKILVDATPIDGCTPLRERLERGDHVGVHALLSGRAFNGTIECETPARVALLDRPSYEALEDEFPVVAIPVCSTLAKELAWKDDLLREIASIRTEDLGEDERKVALEARRRRVARRLAHRGSRLAFYARALVELLRVWAREPASWMLAGFLTGFSGARVVVHEIFAHHADEKYFNLHKVQGFDHPIHIHHFNYGLIIVTVTSLLTFFPAFRQHLRALAFFFGFGAGLILDEFGLIWRFDPDYYQWLSRGAVALVALLLVLVASRGTWTRRLRQIGREGT